MEKAIIRIEEEIKALRIEIQSVWEITLDSYQYYVQSYLD
jgi:putative heme iron utilization protein